MKNIKNKKYNISISIIDSTEKKVEALLEKIKNEYRCVVMKATSEIMPETVLDMFTVKIIQQIFSKHGNFIKIDGAFRFQNSSDITLSQPEIDLTCDDPTKDYLSGVYKMINDSLITYHSTVLKEGLYKIAIGNPDLKPNDGVIDYRQILAFLKMAEEISSLFYEKYSELLVSDIRQYKTTIEKVKKIKKDKTNENNKDSQ